MQEMTLKDIHEAELYVLKKVDAVCRKLGLQYWVMFGTLIGAVREHGFIPWDDDLDIAMKRDDYEKLIQYFMLNGGEADDLHLDHPLTVKTYKFYIARISDKKNRLEFNETKYTTKYTSGIFIDVYPMDGLKNREWLQTWRGFLTRIVVKPEFIPDRAATSQERKLKKSPYKKFMFSCIFSLRNFISGIFLKNDYLLHMMSKFRYKITDILVRKYKFDSSELVGIPSWEPGVCWKKEFFDKTVYFKFEDFEVPAPIGYDEILRASYGDYMQLPPEDQRKPHHEYTAYKP